MKALITGIDGQDGSYLAELLLTKGYDVHGLARRSAKPWANIGHLLDRVTIHCADMTNAITVQTLVRDLCPDELYNLAGQSDVALSFTIPQYTQEVNAGGALHVLEAVRHFSPGTRVYQASTSEMFGLCEPPQKEGTPLWPVSPYGISKVAAHSLVKVYREGHKLFACAGILFNHESERRGHNFVTRKVTNAVARIVNKKQDRLTLFNLDSVRDWGYAPDYVRAMWMMLQQDTPDDFVVGTGVPRTVETLVATAFGVAGLNWQDFVDVTEDKDRKIDAKRLCADPVRAYEVMGWAPETSFADMIQRMVENDIRLTAD